MVISLLESKMKGQKEKNAWLMALLLIGLLGSERPTDHSAVAWTYFLHYRKAQKQVFLPAYETCMKKAFEEKGGEIPK